MNTVASSIQDAEGENVTDGGADEKEKEDNKYQEENKEEKDGKDGNKEHLVDRLIEQVIIVSDLVTY